jgi:hypothetical protein
MDSAPRQWWIHHSSAEERPIQSAARICFRATSEFCNRAAQGNEALKAVMMAVAAASSIGLQLSPWKTVKLL